MFKYIIPHFSFRFHIVRYDSRYDTYMMKHNMRFFDIQYDSRFDNYEWGACNLVHNMRVDTKKHLRERLPQKTHPEGCKAY